MAQGYKEESIMCPACGRANHASARTCANCATALTAFSPMEEAEATDTRRIKAEQEAIYAAELGTVHGGDWSSVSTDRKPGELPLPPQLQAEALRREREQARRDAEARRRERERQERIQREWELQQEVAQRSATRPTICLQCGTPAPPSASGSSFSFCLNCGASFAPEAARQAVSAPDMAAPPVVAPPVVASPVGVLQQQARREVRQAVPAQQMRAHPVTASRNDILPVSEATPYVAAILSFLLPGAGQLRNAQWAKGFGILLAMLVLLSALPIGLWSVTALILRSLVALDAFRIAERRRRGENVEPGQWDCSFIADSARPRKTAKSE